MNVCSHTELSEKHMAVARIGELWKCLVSAPEAVDDSSRQESTACVDKGVADETSDLLTESVAPSPYESTCQDVPLGGKSAPFWTRTKNLLIKSQLLCQLS